MHGAMKKRMHITSLVSGEIDWEWSGKKNIKPLNFVPYVCTIYEIEQIRQIDMDRQIDRQTHILTMMCSVIQCDLEYFTPESSALNIREAKEKEMLVIIIYIIVRRPNSHVGPTYQNVHIRERHGKNFLLLPYLISFKHIATNMYVYVCAYILLHEFKDICKLPVRNGSLRHHLFQTIERSFLL